jgi:hypothetical protein
MTDDIKPALTSKEWEQSFVEGVGNGGASYSVQTNEDGDLMIGMSVSNGPYPFVHFTEVPPSMRHSVAALALLGQSFGFTRIDFDICHSAAAAFDRIARTFDKDGVMWSQAAENNREAAAIARSLAERIGALLPPLGL